MLAGTKKKIECYHWLNSEGQKLHSYHKSRLLLDMINAHAICTPGSGSTVHMLLVSLDQAVPGV